MLLARGARVSPGTTAGRLGAPRTARSAYSLPMLAGRAVRFWIGPCTYRRREPTIRPAGPARDCAPRNQGRPRQDDAPTSVRRRGPGGLGRGQHGLWDRSGTPTVVGGRTPWICSDRPEEPSGL